jgi:ubiquinone/menaquinone biosynthesis C-methylase UbiE
MPKAYYAVVARYYDMEHRSKTDDLAMYSALAAEMGGSVLDIGCGTGRVMLHLAQEGHPVHGIDFSRPMLDVLDKHLADAPYLKRNVSYEEADVLTATPEGRYRMVLLSYNALMHFQEQSDQITLLQKLRRWIESDGLLVIDLPNAGPVFGTQDTDSIVLDQMFLDPETGHLIMLQNVSFLDRTTQLMDVDWIYDDVAGDGLVRRTLVHHTLRYFFHDELMLLLRLTGFSVDAVFGDTQGGPFDESAERMIVYARPAALP